MGIVLAILGELKRMYGLYNDVLRRISESPGIPVENSTRSFWMDPPSNIARHQSIISEDNLGFDIVILGSGISGLSVARTLLSHSQKDGPRILMLEAREACSGATGRNGGHVWPVIFEEYVSLKRKFGHEVAKKMAKIRLAHFESYKQAIEESGLQGLEAVCQLRTVEAIEASMHPETWEGRKRKFKEWQADMPAESATWTMYEGSEASKKFRLASHCCGTIVGSKAGAIWPYRFVTALLEQLLWTFPKRFYLLTQTSCCEISTSKDGYSLKLSSGKQIKAKCVVHATNAHVSHLLPKMRHKIITVRATMSTQRPGQSLSASTLNGKRSYTFIGASNGFDYLTQLPDDGHELMFGGGLGHAGNEGLAEIGIPQDNGFDGEIAGYLNGALSIHFGMENWGVEAEVSASESGSWNRGRTKALWTGTVGWSADGLPWVGRVPDKIAGRASLHPQGTGFSGEWLTAGFSGEGMTAAWLCGQALGRMLLANNTNLDIDWLPSQLKITEKRWRNAKLERQFENAWGH